MSKKRKLPHHITIPNYGAYQVRIVRGGFEHSKSFAWSQYGRPAAALEAAVKWRDAKLQQLAAAGERPRPRGLLQRNNRSGLPGIRFEWRDYGGNWLYLYIVGNWTDQSGRQRAFAYSVEKHGLEGAVKLALKRRSEAGLRTPRIDAALRRLETHYQTIASS